MLPRPGPPSPVAEVPSPFAFPAVPACPPEAAERATKLVRDNLRFVWRLARRFGLHSSDADDVTQRVFCTAVQRIDDIHHGSERAFLYRTTVRIALKFLASSQRRREVEGADALAELADSTPTAEDLLDRHRARELLDCVLRTMPLDLKAVLILFELECFSMAEIADTLGIPRGTVASRLRRAREDFEQRIRRLEARLTFRGGQL